MPDDIKAMFDEYLISLVELVSGVCNARGCSPEATERHKEEAISNFYEYVKEESSINPNFVYNRMQWEDRVGWAIRDIEQHR